MNSINPRHFVDDQFPHALRPLIPATLRTAYRAAADLIADNPILTMAENRGERGRIIAYAVDFGFNRLVESGALPFDKSWEYFARPTGRYLALRAPSSVITISQIADPTKQPRNVGFRQTARLSNAPFFDLPEFVEADEIAGEPHILITHGHQTLTFAHLCIPDPDHLNGYRYRSENLLNLPYEVTLDGPPLEDTEVNFEAIELLKEEVERYRRDHGGQR